MPQTIAELIKKLKSVNTIAIERSVSIANFRAIKKSLKRPLKSAPDIIESLRSTKDEDEIKAIKASGRIAAQALKRTIPYIKPKITESELAGILDLQIRKLAAVNSFDTIVAFGPNASRPHHQPGCTTLRKNDTILIDFGAKYKGYCSDLTRCFAIGKVTAFYKKAYDATMQAQAAAIKMIKAGVEIAKVDAVARAAIVACDLPVYGHSTGHGLGLEVHEAPIVARNSKAKLHQAMVITIEPGIYIPGKLGIRIEDDILVTKTGCEILTQNCPHKPYLL